MSDSPNLRKGDTVYFFPLGTPRYEDALVAIIEDIITNEQGPVASLAVLVQGQFIHHDGVKHTSHEEFKRHPHRLTLDGAFCERDTVEIPAPKEKRVIPLREPPVFNSDVLPQAPTATEQASDQDAFNRAAITEIATANPEWSMEKIFGGLKGAPGLTKTLVTEVLIEMQEQPA